MTVRKQWSRRWQCEGYSLCIDRRGGLLGHSVQFSALKFAHEPRCEVEVMASANDGAQHRHSHTAGQFPNLEDGNKITNPISGCAALIYFIPRDS